MSDRLRGLFALPLRAAGAVPRKHWCEVCRSRMRTRTYGRHSSRRPEKQSLFIDAPDKFRGYARTSARYLCDECRKRNAEAKAALGAELEKTLAAAVGRYAAWLRHAPTISTLPAAVGSLDDDGRIPDPPFVEILELETVADGFARGACGRETWLRLNHHHPRHRSPRKRMPVTYEDVAMYIQASGPGLDTQIWTGSVFRLEDGRIVLHWHTWWEERVD